MILSQSSWTRWAFASQDLLSKWSVGGNRTLHDITRPDKLIASLHSSLVDRGTVPALQRESFSDGFTLALQMIEATFQFRGDSTSPSAPSMEPQVYPSAPPQRDEVVVNDAAASPTASASSPPPRSDTAPNSPIVRPGEGATTRSVPTQVSTISGVVLAAHIFTKCSLRLQLKRAHRRIAELTTEREDICRELVRVATSSRLMPTLLVPAGTTPSVPASSLSATERRRLFVMKLIWSMTSTWQRLERAQRAAQLEEENLVHEDDDARKPHNYDEVVLMPRRGGASPTPGLIPPALRKLSDDTFELLNGWLGAAEVYGMRSSSSVPLQPTSQAGGGMTHHHNSPSSRQQLRLLDDENDDDLGAALRLSGDSHDRVRVDAHVPESVYMPIFLCRRCRETGLGNVTYDPAHQRLRIDHQQSNNVRRYVTESPRPPPALTARTRHAAPEHPSVPTHRQHARGNSPNPSHRPKPPPAISGGGVVLPILHCASQRPDISRGLLGQSPRQQQHRHVWESSTHGVYVPHR